jgi:hypothetical protein
MDKTLMVKQFLCTWTNKYGTVMNVYESGQPGYVVLRPTDKYGCEGGLEWAYKRSDLKVKFPRP